MASKKKQTTDLPWLEHYPSGIHWDTDIPTAPLGSIIDKAKEQFPYHHALEFMGKVITYEELAVMSDQFAKGLQSCVCNN